MVLAACARADAANFWDPGLTTQTVRTDYDSISAGTTTDPIAVTTLNPSFETPVLCGGPALPACTTSAYLYAPTAPGVAWKFNGSGGIQHDGSAWGAAPSPDGSQSMFVQNTGSASQTMNLAAGPRMLTFLAARRGTQLQPVRVTVDGSQVGSLVQPPGPAFSPFSIPISIATPGLHTLAFAGTDGSGDKSTLIDSVCVPGTVAMPYPCPADPNLVTTISGTEGAFPSGPTSYGSTSNAWWKNYSWGTGNFWVLSIQNEPGFRTCNSGPPNLSLPRSSPGSGIFGFDIIDDPPAGEYFNRAHLVLNLDASVNPCPSSTNIPFIAFGAQSNRGNGGPVGQLNTASGHTLSFVARLWAYNTMRYKTGGGGLMELIVLSRWPDQFGRNVPRMIQVILFDDNIPAAEPLHRHWNWPVSGSMFANGADIAYFFPRQAQRYCGMTIPALQSTDTHYTIDLQALFECASNLGLFDTPMPSGTLAITGVHWANEAAADYGALWTSVHGIYMQ